VGRGAAESWEVCEGRWEGAREVMRQSWIPFPLFFRFRLGRVLMFPSYSCFKLLLFLYVFREILYFFTFFSLLVSFLKCFVYAFIGVSLL